MSHQFDDNSAIDVLPLGVVVETLGPHRCSHHEPDRRDEIGEDELARELAIFEPPPVESVEGGSDLIGAKSLGHPAIFAWRGRSV